MLGGPNSSERTDALSKALAVCEMLGVPNKTEGPAQAITFLGITIDTPAQITPRQTWPITCLNPKVAEPQETPKAPATLPNRTPSSHSHSGPTWQAFSETYDRHIKEGSTTTPFCHVGPRFSLGLSMVGYVPTSLEWSESVEGAATKCFSYIRCIRLLGVWCISGQTVATATVASTLAGPHRRSWLP